MEGLKRLSDEVLKTVAKTMNKAEKLDYMKVMGIQLSYLDYEIFKHQMKAKEPIKINNIPLSFNKNTMSGKVLFHLQNPTGVSFIETVVI